MSVSDELISQFVKTISNTGNDEAEVIVYGTVVEDGSTLYVKLDGSDVLTPISYTTEILAGDRVIVTIRNHTATVTGNLDNPAFGTKTAGSLSTTIEQTAEAIRLEAADSDAQLKALIEVTAASIRQEVSDGDASVTSLIEQTASEIRSEVADANAELESKITQTADEINLTISNNQEEFTTFKQTIEGWEFVDENGSIIIEDGSIKWDYLADDAQTKVEDAQDTANSAASTANTALSTASSAQDIADDALDNLKLLADGQYSGGTFIDNKNLYSPNLYGDTINLLDGNSRLVGTMSLQYSNTYAFDLNSQLSVRLNAAAGYNAFMGVDNSIGVAVYGSTGYIGIHGLLRMTENYGSTLPSTGVEGQVFFLLDS